MDEGLLSIGAFSRAALLSIKKLRAYHDQGLLLPAQVDDRTGYRLYHWSQLADAAVIVRLRAVDLPLDQVQEVLRARDPAVTRAVLGDHLATMRARLEEIAQAVDELHDAVEHPGTHTPVHLRTVGAQPVLTLSGKVREQDFAGFLGAAYGQLGETSERLGLPPAGPAGALYPPEVSDDPVEVTAFVPIASTQAEPLPSLIDGPVTTGKLPTTTMAVIGHSGPYETLGDAYRLLGTWVAQNATPSGLPVREIYLVSYAETDDPDEFRTEIHWPVRQPRA